MNRILACLIPAILAASTLITRAQTVPDLPEPGIILYGQVFFDGH